MPLPVRKHPERDGSGGKKSKSHQDPQPPAAGKPDSGSGRGDEDSVGVDELV